MAKNSNKGGIRSTKDKEHAAYLKKHGVRRTIGRCPLCYRMIALDRMHNHIAVGCK